MIFIPNRKVSTPNYSSVYREGKSLDLLISARHRRSLRLRFNPTRIPWTGDGVSCVKEYYWKVVIGGKRKRKIQQNEKSFVIFFSKDHSAHIRKVPDRKGMCPDTFSPSRFSMQKQIAGRSRLKEVGVFRWSEEEKSKHFIIRKLFYTAKDCEIKKIKIKK